MYLGIMVGGAVSDTPVKPLQTFKQKRLIGPPGKNSLSEKNTINQQDDGMQEGTGDPLSKEG